MKHIFWLPENCEDLCCLKSWKSINIVLEKLLGELTRCDGNGLIGNRMLNKKRTIVVVWQLCRAYSQWQTLKSAIFQSIITSPPALTVVHRVIKTENKLKSSDVVKWYLMLKLCDCPYIPTRRPGTIWSPHILRLRSSFSGRPCSSRAFVDIDQGMGIDLGMV